MIGKTPVYSIYPSILRGNGGGHLLRCRELAEGLGGGARIYLPDAGKPGFFSREEVLRMVGGGGDAGNIVFSPSEGPGIHILDTRQTPDDRFRTLIRRGPVIAVDEAGGARRFASFVIDTLPRLDGAGANYRSTGLLDLPEPGKKPGKGVLVTFGCEDPAGLSSRLVRSIVPGFFDPEDITVIRPFIHGPVEFPEGVRLLEPVRDLRDHLAEYDLVFCSFGLTAFEACAAGCRVVLFNPTRYHRALSRGAGFPEIGVLRPRLKKLEGLLADRVVLSRRCASLIPETGISSVSLLKELDFSGPRGCPVCGEVMNPRVARFEDATYFRCTDCGIVYREGFRGMRETYDRDYFFTEYREQYGRTYLEDADAIRRLSAPRVAVLKRMAGNAPGSPRLLDAGCAYGPFLQVAREAGFDVFGLDASRDAAEYVTKNLGIPAAASTFEDYDPEVHTGGGTFDVITMWYVIEHFPDLDGVLKKIGAMLRPGGVFAFSTPNLAGISGRRDIDAFLRASPEDHRSVFSPSSARKVLRMYGMSLERIRITGHHPERFPRGPGVLYAGVSRLFGLGDTFEAYAVKRGYHGGV